MKTVRAGRAAAALLGMMTCLSVPMTAWAGQVVLDDRAGILAGGRRQVEQAAAQAPFDVRILTRRNMSSKAELDRLVDDAARLAGGNTVALGVDTGLRRVHIAAHNAWLDSGHVDEAQRTAGTRFRSGDWAGGMAAAIDQLAAAAQSRRAAAGQAVGGAAAGRAPADARSGAPASAGRSEASRGASERHGFPWGLILLLIGGFILLRLFLARGRSRQSQASRRGFGYGHPGAGSPAHGPGGQPPGYGRPGDYGAGGSGRGGAGRGGGLLGGLGGGILGYMLGRHARGQDPRGPDDQPPQAGGGDAGGFASGGDSGEFGAGGDSGDFGGGGDGGGDSGDF